MKHTSVIAAIQAAAHTLCPLELPPLAALQMNRIYAILDTMQLPDTLSEADVTLQATVQELAEAAYHAGWQDSRLTLGEL